MLAVVNAAAYNVLEDSHSVYLLIFACQIEFTYVELRGQLLEGEILAEMVLNVVVYRSELLLERGIILAR